MKAIFCLLLLAVVASQAAVVGPYSPANVSVGYPQPGDRLLSREFLQKDAIANAVQYQDFTYRGNATTRISTVRATALGPQNGAAWISYGGVGWYAVTIRVQSARGWGYHYMVEVWGR